MSESRPVRLRDGSTVWVPADADDLQAARHLRAQGVPPQVMPGELAVKIGSTFTDPGTRREQFGRGFRNFWAQRGFGDAASVVQGDLDQYGPRPTGFQLAGELATPVGVSLALPGKGLAGIGLQAAGQAGLEALRDDATATDVATVGALAAGGTAGGQMFARAFSGASRLARGGDQIHQTTSPYLRTVSETMRTRGLVNRANQRALNRAVARSFGENADNLSPEVLNRAADRIGQQFNALIPKTGKFNIAAVRAAQADVPPGTLGARANRVLRSVDGDEWTGQDVQRLREALHRQWQAELPGGAKENIGFVLESLDDLIASQYTGGGAAWAREYRVARELWKNLKLAESLPTVQDTGNVTAQALSRKLGQDQGYGSTFVRGRYDQTLPETANMMQTVRAAAQEARAGLPSSGTAERLLMTGGGIAAGAGVLSGSPELALVGGALALGGAAGLGSIGSNVAAGTGGRLGAVTAGQQGVIRDNLAAQREARNQERLRRRIERAGGD